MNSIQISQWCARLWLLLFLALLGGYGLTARAAPEPAGWYAGDMHVHRSCGGSPESVSSLYNKMSTHDLAVISLLADMGNGEVQNPVTDLPLVTGQDASISTPGRIVHWDAEWHWDATYNQYPHQALGGHLVVLGLAGAQQIWQEYTYPILNWARQQNGIAGFAHMQYLGSGIPQSLNCCIPIEYPVEVALGAADFISEDVTGSDSAIQAYYRLLNTGFRPGLAAGTDYPCGVSELGSLLTYVQVAKVGDGQMTYRNWIEGIKRGRTVISRNGHNEFLDLKVNSTAAPGDEIQLPAGGGTVQVQISWTAKQNLSGTIELVHNGVVVASQQASVTASVPANLTTTVNFTKSGWLAARRMDGNGHQAHTAAVFVTVNNAPVRASAADAEFYVQWMDNLLAKTSPGGEWNFYFPTKLSEAQTRYQTARAIYQQIALEAGATPPPLAITTTSLPEGIVNVAYSVTLTASGGITPYVWSIASGSLPPGLTLNPSSGAITGIPTTVGTSSFTARVSDASSQTATQSLGITISATPTAATLWLPSATPAVAADSDTGAVELGVKFRSSVNGSITGIRFYKGSANTGTHVGNLWASNGTLLATATFSNESTSGWQQVSFASPVAITANTVYVASYHAPNGRYSVNTGYFASTGITNGLLYALRDGESGGNGVYHYGSGGVFPTDTYQASNYWVDVVFQAAGAAPTLTTITVTPVNPTILAGATQQFVATGTYSDNSTQDVTSQATWTSSSTAVATINASSGLATAVAAGATTISAALSGVTGSTTLTVQAQATPLAITTTSLPGGTVNVAYSATLTASGGITPYTWSISGGSLPLGLTLNPSSGAITGTPMAAGTSSFTVQASDGGNPAQTATRDLSISIAATPPVATSIWLSTAAPGTADSGPDSAVELGVKFRSDIDGSITGIRFYKGSGNTGTHVGNLWTSAGALLASATFTGETASGWQQVDFANPVAITANTVYVASYHTNVGHYSENQNYFATTGIDNPPLHALANGVSGGNGVYVYGSASAFPNQTWNATNYWVDVVFSSGPQPLAIATTSLSSGSVGVAYSATLAASGGTPPYTSWSISSGSLPADLTLNSATGAITGIPTVTGAFNFTVQVIDSSGGVASRSLSIIINQPATNTGFLSPNANAAVTTNAGDNNGFQTNPTNAYADDGLFAVDTNCGTGVSTSCTANGKDKHLYHNYGFSLPGGATINGIEVRLDARADSTTSSPRMCVQLSWNGGVTWTAAKTTTTLSTTEQAYILGGAADTWGRAWASGEFSNANFRVRIINVASSTARDFSLDWVAVRVTYQ